MTLKEALEKEKFWLSAGATHVRITIVVFGKTDEEHLYAVTPCYN